MNYIKVNILLNNRIVSMRTDTPGLYSLSIDRHLIETSDHIHEVSITKDLVILTTEDPAFRDGAKVAPVEEKVWMQNTINAYDWNGRHVWNIADIIGAIKTHMTGGFLFTHDILEDDVRAAEAEGHDLYACFDWAGHRYLIDLDERKVIQVIIT